MSTPTTSKATPIGETPPRRREREEEEEEGMEGYAPEKPAMAAGESAMGSEEEEADPPHDQDALLGDDADADDDDDEEDESYEDEDEVGSTDENDMDDMDEPELEFDEMGMDLEALDEFYKYHKWPNNNYAEVMAEEGSDVHLSHNSHNCYLPYELGPELAREEAEMGHFRSGAITPDGMIEEDFEEELGSPSEEDVNDPATEFRDIAKYGIVQVAGDDTLGRKVIVVSSCRLPLNTELDHQRFLQYLKHTLDQYVENDYTLVYFHHGLNSKNKPTFKWLRQAYREFDRKYKKNLKALYLVHPTNFIKILWGIFKPIISAKFGRKVMYVNYLHELAQHLQLDQLIIPQRVKEHDANLLAINKPRPVPTSITHAPPPTQQFGVELKFIKNHNKDIIPPVVQQCVTYIRENGLETEGIFRRSANATVLKQVQHQMNEGIQVDFASLMDIHIPAAILKSFLRQLPEPLLTFDLYDHIVRVQTLENKEKVEEMKRILHDELPEDNYYVLKYIIHFLTEVEAKSSINRMDGVNLAIVFGPNLMWSKSTASLTSMGYVNACAALLIREYDELFSK